MILPFGNELLKLLEKENKPEAQNSAEISYIPTSTYDKYSQNNYTGYIFGS